MIVPNSRTTISGCPFRAAHLTALCIKPGRIIHFSAPHIGDSERYKAAVSQRLQFLPGIRQIRSMSGLPVLYTAVFSDEKTIHYAPDKLKERENLITGMPGSDGLEEVIWLVDTTDSGCVLYHDLKEERLVLTLK